MGQFTLEYLDFHVKMAGSFLWMFIAMLEKWSWKTWIKDSIQLSLQGSFPCEAPCSGSFGAMESFQELGLLNPKKTPGVCEPRPTILTWEVMQELTEPRIYRTLAMFTIRRTILVLPSCNMIWLSKNKVVFSIVTDLNGASELGGPQEPWFPYKNRSSWSSRWTTGYWGHCKKHCQSWILCFY